MADAAEVLTELRDLRVPESSGTGALADAAAAFALGLAAALLLAVLLRAITIRRPSRRAAALTELTAARGLAPAERLMVQAAILKRAATDLGITDQAAGEAHGPSDRGDWLLALDRQLGRQFFTSGPGAGLRQSLYRPAITIDPEVIEPEVIRVLRRVKG